LRFDWYDNIEEPGIFGAFSFTESNLDITAPEWYYVSIGTLTQGTDIVLMTTEQATVYLVPAETLSDTTSIKEAAVAVIDATAYTQAKLSTSGLIAGDYVVYALDNAKNISEPSRVITIQFPVNASVIAHNLEISITYDSAYNLMTIKSNNELKLINVYNILGKKVKNVVCQGNVYNLKTDGFNAGVYFVHVYDTKGNIKRDKIPVV